MGDSVNELEPLLEVNTDKVDTEIPAPASGTVLKIMAAEGVPAKVGAVLAFIGKPGELVEGSTPATSPVKAEEQKPAAEQPATLNLQPSTKQDIGFISPVVAKIAVEYGVNLQQVQGTGLNGRITKNDVLNFVENGKKTVDHGPQTIVHRPPSTVSAAPGDQLIKHTVIRRQIAEHMVHSKHTSPHVLTVMEADMSRVAKHRSANKDIFARDGVKLTFTAYFMAAIVAGLKDVSDCQLFLDRRREFSFTRMSILAWPPHWARKD